MKSRRHIKHSLLFHSFTNNLMDRIIRKTKSLSALFASKAPPTPPVPPIPTLPPLPDFPPPTPLFNMPHPHFHNRRGDPKSLCSMTIPTNNEKLEAIRVTEEIIDAMLDDTVIKANPRTKEKATQTEL